MDGLINGGIAFKIDAVGLNTPLIFESIAANGIFEPGETWRFAVQDFTTTDGDLPDEFVTPGLVAPGMGDTKPSIVATVVPEPTATALLGCVLAGMAARRRRH